MNNTKEDIEKQKKERLGLEKYNKQGCLMKIVEYNSTSDITIEFQDKYKTQKKTIWCAFKNGEIKDDYYPSVCGVGIIGDKYQKYIKGKMIKEYVTWYDMIYRCYDEKIKNKYKTYQNVSCCEEWLLYENFYKWLHSQENFDKWLNGHRWCLDKDILIKGNKIYSPNACCLVPPIINNLFTKCDNLRGNYPIGVTFDKRINKYHAVVSMDIVYQRQYTRQLGDYPTPEDAFYLGYKPAKEAYIKQVAKEEYKKGNITEKCYNAMMNYQVEITD